MNRMLAAFAQHRLNTPRGFAVGARLLRFVFALVYDDNAAHDKVEKQAVILIHITINVNAAAPTRCSGSRFL
jgi:hypothetical protein